jgi:hypothetical protein
LEGGHSEKFPKRRKMEDGKTCLEKSYDRFVVKAAMTHLLKVLICNTGKLAQEIELQFLVGISMHPHIGFVYIKTTCFDIGRR